MKRVFAIAAALALFAGAAAAQTPAKVDPAKLELARQLYAEVGGADALKARLAAMLSGVSQMMKSVVPASNTKLSDALVKDIGDVEMQMAPQIIDIGSEVYAETFTEQELRDMLAYQRSPSGRSTRAKQPELTRQMFVRLGPLMTAMMPQMMQKTLDRACEEAQCTPEVRKQVADAMGKALQPKGS